MRAKSKASKPANSAAASRDQTGPESTATASLQAKSHKVEAISNSTSPGDNPRALRQLREREQNPALQAAMQKNSAPLVANNSSSATPKTAASSVQAEAHGQAIESHQAMSETMPSDSDAAPLQMAGAEGVVQRALVPLDGFKSQFKNDKERQSNISEYHAQICDDLKLYHQNEYDVAKSIPDEIALKYDIRKMALERVILGCNLWLHYPVRKPPTEGPMEPWNAVQGLKTDATDELNSYYKNAEGRAELSQLLNAKKGQKQSDVYTADEFKGDADLGMVSANVGDMSAVVGKLKEFHAIQEKPADDGTRVAKLTTLDALMALATATVEATRKSKNSKSKPGFWKNEQAHLDALDNLIQMLKNNRGRYEDAHSWRMNLQNLESRNEDAAAGTGVSMDDVDSDWVDVDDGYTPAKELAAETDEIVKRLSDNGGN